MTSKLAHGGFGEEAGSGLSCARGDGVLRRGCVNRPPATERRVGYDARRKEHAESAPRAEEGRRWSLGMEAIFRVKRAPTSSWTFLLCPLQPSSLAIQPSSLGHLKHDRMRKSPRGNPTGPPRPMRQHLILSEDHQPMAGKLESPASEPRRRGKLRRRICLCGTADCKIGLALSCKCNNF